jgi:hypothetical protein
MARNVTKTDDFIETSRHIKQVDSGLIQSSDVPKNLDAGMVSAKNTLAEDVPQAIAEKQPREKKQVQHKIKSLISEIYLNQMLDSLQITEEKLKEILPDVAINGAQIGLSLKNFKALEEQAMKAINELSEEQQIQFKGELRKLDENLKIALVNLSTKNADVKSPIKIAVQLSQLTERAKSAHVLEASHSPPKPTGSPPRSMGPPPVFMPTKSAASSAVIQRASVRRPPVPPRDYPKEASIVSPVKSSNETLQEVIQKTLQVDKKIGASLINLMQDVLIKKGEVDIEFAAQQKEKAKHKTDNHATYPAYYAKTETKKAALDKLVHDLVASCRSGSLDQVSKVIKNACQDPSLKTTRNWSLGGLRQSALSKELMDLNRNLDKEIAKSPKVDLPIEQSMTIKKK